MGLQPAVRDQNGLAQNGALSGEIAHEMHRVGRIAGLTPKQFRDL